MCVVWMFFCDLSPEKSKGACFSEIVCFSVKYFRSKDVLIRKMFVFDHMSGIVPMFESERLAFGSFPS